MADETTSSKLAAMKARREELELQILEEQVSGMKAKRLSQEQDRKRQQHEIAETARQSALRQEACTHRKGGKDKEGLVNGNDANFAVITNTYPTGHVEVMCLRCQKVWAAPDAAIRKVDPKLFKELEREYKEARAMTTDNAPSGKRLFTIEKAA